MQTRSALLVEIGERIRDSGLVELIYVREPLFFEGWAYFRQHGDKRYSRTDCLSFVVMQQRSVRNALAFDKHFEQAGFGCIPLILLFDTHAKNGRP